MEPRNGPPERDHMSTNYDVCSSVRQARVRNCQQTFMDDNKYRPLQKSSCYATELTRSPRQLFAMALAINMAFLAVSIPAASAHGHTSTVTSGPFITFHNQLKNDGSTSSGTSSVALEQPTEQPTQPSTGSPRFPGPFIDNGLYSVK
jgi:hypothetical protein